MSQHENKKIKISLKVCKNTRKKKTECEKIKLPKNKNSHDKYFNCNVYDITFFFLLSLFWSTVTSTYNNTSFESIVYILLT